MLNQLLLVTDGCSNIGIDPVVAASHARSENITVHVVGIIDDGDIGKRGEREIAQIAEAGGGMHRIVETRALSGTMQMMTRQTVMQTVQQAVQTELRQIFGTKALEALPPEHRAEVARVVDQVSEDTRLRVALLIDASASMRPKLAQVEEAIHDLSMSLSARQGESEVAVFHFPGSGQPFYDIDIDTGWTNQLHAIGSLFHNINMRGATPTGPAIMRAVEYFEKGFLTKDHRMEDDVSREVRRGEDGFLSDYIV